MVLSVAEIIDQLTNIKEVSLLYSAPQRSQESLVRTDISKMSHRQKQMVPPSAWTAIAAIRHTSRNLSHPRQRRLRSIFFAWGW